MLLSFLIAAALVAICFFVHAAVLHRLAKIIMRSERPLKRPVRTVLFCIFAAHLVEAVVYAIGITLIVSAGSGSLAGEVGSKDGWVLEHFYFSLASYTSLGIGDIIPHGGLRLLAGIEALNGLVLIAWSASFTYLTMERFWSIGGPSQRPDG